MARHLKGLFLTACVSVANKAVLQKSKHELPTLHLACCRDLAAISGDTGWLEARHFQTFAFQIAVLSSTFVSVLQEQGGRARPLPLRTAQTCKTLGTAILRSGPFPHLGFFSDTVLTDHATAMSL